MSYARRGPPKEQAIKRQPTTRGQYGIAHVRALSQVSDEAMTEYALTFFYDRDKRGTRKFPTDLEVVMYLRQTFSLENAKAVAVLRSMKRRIAERVNATLETLPQNVIAELQDQIQLARRAKDHGAAIRGLIALGRFAGLDQPQVAPEAQVRQLSDAALEAALSSSISRALETMPADKFEDLVRRREIAKAKGAAVMDAEGTEGTE